MKLLSDFYLMVGWQPYTWFSLLVLASLADAVTTVYALKMPGLGEANPAVRWLARRVGLVPALLVLKATPLAGLFLTLQANILFVPLAVLIYLAVIGWNLWQIGRA